MGGSFYPIYLRPANLSHEAWTREKAAHLWALLPIYKADPEVEGSTDPLVGAMGRQLRYGWEGSQAALWFQANTCHRMHAYTGWTCTTPA